MSKITVTTIAGLTSGGDANKVKIESGDTLEVVTNATVGGTLGVTGASTLTGDLTVDTNTFKVDTTNNHVGFGTASPQAPIDATLAAGADWVARFQNTTSGTPYGVQVYDAGSSSAGYPLLQVTNSAGNAPYFRVDSSTGFVTTPKQPSFFATLSSNTTFDANNTTSAYINYNSEVYDNGNNHSNGQFTAPIAGVYYFRAEAYTNNHCTQSWFVVNGARAAGTDTTYRSQDASANFCGNSVILKLAANDVVSFHPYRSGFNSMTVNANNNHSWFRGHLLG